LTAEVRRYVLLVAAYLVSRVALAVLGLRMHVAHDWLFFHDVELLQTRLVESLWYGHAFPPGMNLLAGVVLKSGIDPTLAYTVVFWGLGTVSVVSLASVARALDLSWRTTGGLVALFAMAPQTLFFEHLLFHTYPAAALLLASTALFVRARGRGSAAWLACFAVCALLAFLRSTFHLGWVVGLLALAAAVERDRLRVVARGAVVPMLLVLALYAKNASIVGSFGASSWLGFNVAKVTTQQLPRSERRAWVADGRMHPASAIPLYAPPAAYSRVIDPGPPTGVPVLDQTHRSAGPPNYNHRVYPRASRARMRGNLAYLRARPDHYLATVVANVRAFFGPSTRWHPRDETDSPHTDHRRALGPWERLWNGGVHGFLQPVGLYVPLVLVAAFGVARVARRTVGGTGGSADGVVLLLAYQCLWVGLVSCLVETGELARYRFLIEAQLWLLVAATHRRAWSHFTSARKLPPSASAPVATSAVATQGGSHGSSAMMTSVS
jgi:hypothetical protein